MRGNHGVIGEEFFVLVSLHEIAEVVRSDVRSILTHSVIDLLAVDLESGVGESWRTTSQLPEAVFIEPEIVRAFESAVELPLTGDHGFVASFLEEVPESLDLGVHHTKANVVSVVVDAGHDLDTARGANGLRVAVLEADPGGRKLIESGRVVFFAAIGADAFKAHIIGHDEYDVGSILCKGCGAHRKSGEK